MSFISLKGQEVYHPHQLIVSGSKASLKSYIRHNQYTRNSSSIIYESISKKPDVFLLKNIPDGRIRSIYKGLQKKKGLSVSYDFYVNPRRSPNDIMIQDQWSLEVIRAFEAWDETIGDTDFGDRQPVVAVLDDGFDSNHEDLENRIYLNQYEIPNNEIDDDNNGYVDDYRGINLNTLNDVHTRLKHGSAVLGIIGAAGNNNLGISGILWNANMLLISGINTESDIIKGYEYIYQMRKRYNDTNGQEGAYIVVSNYSGGLDNAWAVDHPEWCEMYEKLGRVGVLNIGATTNNYTKIEDIGDMPSTCGSPYLITVNNTGRLDDFEESGYSTEFVDLAAPGTGTISLNLNNRYASFGGTSASSAHVAAAATLLYTIPCEVFYEMAVNKPSVAALTVKDALIQGVDLLEDLNDKTKSGGRLNILNSMKELSTLCSQDIAPFGIADIIYDNQSLQINYTTDKFELYNLELFSIDGRKIFSTSFNTSLFGEKRIDISSYFIRTGIYIVSLSSDSDTINKKIYIQSLK